MADTVTRTLLTAADILSRATISAVTPDLARRVLDMAAGRVHGVADLTVEASRAGQAHATTPRWHPARRALYEQATQAAGVLDAAHDAMQDDVDAALVVLALNGPLPTTALTSLCRDLADPLRVAAPR